MSRGNRGVAKNCKQRPGPPSSCRREVDQFEEFGFRIRRNGCIGDGIRKSIEGCRCGGGFLKRGSGERRKGKDGRAEEE